MRRLLNLATRELIDTVPMLVAALTMGTVFFIFTIPLAYWLAGALSRAGIKRMGRQTARLKRLQIERKIRKRNDDDFKVA